MIRLLKALVLVPLAVIVVLLAVANRQPVVLSFDPFSRAAPEFSATLPLFAVIFIAVALGILIGGISAWLVQGKHRRAERGFKRELAHLRSETERLRQRVGALPGLPAYPANRPPA